MAFHPAELMVMAAIAEGGAASVGQPVRPAPTPTNIAVRTSAEQRETALGLTLQHYGSHAFTPEETVDLARKLALFIAEG